MLNYYLTFVVENEERLFYSFFAENGLLPFYKHRKIDFISHH